MTGLRIAENLHLPDEAVTETFAILGWAAGLFEGEGTISIARRGQDDTYRLQVMVSNTDVQASLGLEFRAHQPRRKSVWSRADYKVRQREFYKQMRQRNLRGQAALAAAADVDLDGVRAAQVLLLGGSS